MLQLPPIYFSCCCVFIACGTVIIVLHISFPYDCCHDHVECLVIFASCIMFILYYIALHHPCFVLCFMMWFFLCHCCCICIMSIMPWFASWSLVVWSRVKPPLLLISTSFMQHTHTSNHSSSSPKFLFHPNFTFLLYHIYFHVTFPLSRKCSLFSWC